MADQKRWFKVWCSLLIDMDNVPDEIIGKWTRLGCRIASVGTKGTAEFADRAHLARFLGVPVEAVRDVIALIPNVTMNETISPLSNVTVPVLDNCAEGENIPPFKRHGGVSVIMRNWTKYQEDSTQAERQKTSRSKKRREENIARTDVRAVFRHGSNNGNDSVRELRNEWYHPDGCIRTEHITNDPSGRQCTEHRGGI